MERQFDGRTRQARALTVLGVVLLVSGCAVMSGEGSVWRPESPQTEDWRIGMSWPEPEPPLPQHESARSAKVESSEETKPAPHAREGRPPRDPVQTPFPNAVGGFEWWQSKAQFATTCREAGGAAKQEGVNGLVCSLAPINGLPVNVDLASGTFCEGRLCAMALVFYRGDLADSYDKLRAAIVAKYGAPLADAPREDAPVCTVMGEDDESNRYWFWGTKALTFAVHCAENGPTVEVTYLTDEALRWGEEQNRKRQQSF